MSIALNPYLNFDGNAEQAIKLYEKVLGAKTENIMRFAEAKGMEVPAQHKNRILHASLRIGDGVIMMSDTQPGMPLSVGNNVHVSLNCSDIADMTKKFEALAAGGKVTMPLHDAFWGAKFGMLVDAFGIHWMFNAQK